MFGLKKRRRKKARAKRRSKLIRRFGREAMKRSNLTAIVPDMIEAGAQIERVRFQVAEMGPILERIKENAARVQEDIAGIKASVERSGLKLSK